MIGFYYMAHPAFAEIPDETVAAICSEAYEHDYVFSVDAAVAQRYDQAALYNGNAVLLAANVCFIDQSTRTFGNVFAPTPILSREDVPEASELYRKSVGELQGEPFAALAAPVTSLQGTVDGMWGWGLRNVHNRGLRLLAAHVVTRQREDGELTDALIFPRSFSEDLPVIVRSDYTRMLRLKDQLPTKADRDAFDQAFGPVLRRDPAAKIIGNMLAASFLPTPEQNDASLGIAKTD